MEISLFGAPNNEIREYDSKQTILDRLVHQLAYEICHEVSIYYFHRINAIAMKMSAAERDMPQWAGAWEIGNLQTQFPEMQTHYNDSLF